LNIVADENIDVQIIERLRADRHSVQSVAEFEPGIDDEAVLRESRETNAILLTADKDFGELVFRQGLVHSGVVLIRLAGMAPETKADIVSEVFAHHAPELYRAFSVLSPRALRIRKLE
jgi:predicted nuclease of predicted toxin-antitoxin system